MSTPTKTFGTVNTGASTTNPHTSNGITTTAALTTNQTIQAAPNQNDILSETTTTTDHGSKSNTNLDDVITTAIKPTINYGIELTTNPTGANNASIESTIDHDTKITTGFEEATVSTFTTKTTEADIKKVELLI